MKKMKTLASLVLALVLAMALTVPAFADDTGSITVDNPQDGQTYTAYKIFDMTYAPVEGEAADHYSYTYTKGNTALDALIAEYFNTNATAANANVLLVSGFKTGKSAASFAAALYTAIEANTLTLTGGVPLEGTKPTAELSWGYYYVSSTTGTVCNLDSNAPDVTIYDKNEAPDIVKTSPSVDTVDVGQVVDYQVVGDVPSTTGYTTYTYKISDNMIPANGLTYVQNSVKVSIGGTVTNKVQNVSDEFTAFGDNIDYAVKQETNGFMVWVNVMKMTVGAEIKVEYQAKVNENAITVNTLENTATLNYSKNPANTNEIGTDTSKDTVYTSNITINKTDGSNNNVALEGAKFVLAKVVNNEIVGYYHYDATNNEVSWPTTYANEDVKESKIVAGATNATVNFNGLANGTYRLIEVEAPKGYNLLKAGEIDDITVNTSATNDTVNYSNNVANFAGAVLPSTGGMGTTLFYTIGGLLVVCSAILIVTKKRMSSMA